MVNRYFPDEEMPALRRYSTRAPGYSLSHDREPILSHDMHHNYRAQHAQIHDRNPDRRSPDNDMSSKPRSRIPVACGRCRKRKIKCSGDVGNGGPCTSCKSAQHNECAFLRVSSRDMPMKIEVPSYEYDLSNGGAASRSNSRIQLYAPHPYVPHSSLPVESSYPFRSNSLSTYQIHPRNYYPIPLNEYAEGAPIDYDVHSSGYQAYGADNPPMPAQFIPSGAPRGWNGLPRNSLFIEQSDAPYNYSPVGFHGNNFPLRPHPTPESRSLSLNGVATSLPGPLATDRMLPIPATNRQNPVMPYHRPTENIMPTGQLGWNNYQSEYPPRNTLKSQNMESISENGSIASSYMPMASSSPESIASSQMTYNSQQMSMSQQQQHQQGDMFTPPGSDNMYGTEASDSSYGHSNNGSKRSSHSSQASHADTPPMSALPPIANDSLSNGQRYVPVSYHQVSSYPTPPMSSIPSNGSGQQPPILIDS